MRLDGCGLFVEYMAKMSFQQTMTLLLTVGYIADKEAGAVHLSSVTGADIFGLLSAPVLSLQAAAGIKTISASSMPIADLRVLTVLFIS